MASRLDQSSFKLCLMVWWALWGARNDEICNDGLIWLLPEHLAGGKSSRVFVSSHIHIEALVAREGPLWLVKGSYWLSIGVFNISSLKLILSKSLQLWIQPHLICHSIGTSLGTRKLYKPRSLKLLLPTLGANPTRLLTILLATPSPHPVIARDLLK